MTNAELSDAAGVAHQPAGTHPRIVSLVPSITELLFALGLAPFVVGRTTFCIHPRDAVGSVARIGGTKHPNLDKLRALSASHVIVNIDENRKEDADAIRSFVPNIIVTHPTAPEDNLHLYRLLGAIFSRQQIAERLCAEFAKELANLERVAHAHPTSDVLYLIWRDPWMTVSRDTYVSRMLALIGWRTVLDDPHTRYPAIALDAELLRRVDHVLLSSEPFPFKAQHIEEIRAIAGDDARAQASLIDGEMISWYGVRAIAGLRYLVSKLDEVGAN